MIDMEKVIKELHDARRYLEDKEWSDRGASPHIDAINDALALLKEYCHNCKLECLLQRYDQLKEKYDKLLKEQEAVKPKSKVRHGANSQIQHFCGNCNTMLHGKPKFCSECGKGVLW